MSFLSNISASSSSSALAGHSRTLVGVVQDVTGRLLTVEIDAKSYWRPHEGSYLLPEGFGVTINAGNLVTIQIDAEDNITDLRVLS